MRRGLPAVVAILVVLPTATARVQQRFRSGVETVRLDVLVLDRGEPVRGLGAHDFEVRDNGVVQTVDRVSLEQIPLNLVAALDTSNSLAGERLEHLRAAAGAMLDGLRQGDQAGLITFSEVVTQRSGLTSDVQRIRTALERMQPDGLTALVDGAFAGMMLAQSDSDRALEVVFSDGVDTASWLTPAAVLDAAKRSNTVVYAVFAGFGSAPPFLEDLAAFTGGQVFENPDVAALQPTFTRILQEFRERYLVTYSPAGVDPGGWHQVRVGIRGRRATVKARPGYMRGAS